MDEWQQLNLRQQTYMKEIYTQDQAQEQTEKRRKEIPLPLLYFITL
jgi:hypothetical protein